MLPNLISGQALIRLHHSILQLVSINLHWWCVSFYQLVQILYLHSRWLSLVATCAGGAPPWKDILQLALCGGGVVCTVSASMSTWWCSMCVCVVAEHIALVYTATSAHTPHAGVVVLSQLVL